MCKAISLFNSLMSPKFCYSQFVGYSKAWPSCLWQQTISGFSNYSCTLISLSLGYSNYDLHGCDNELYPASYYPISLVYFKQDCPCPRTHLLLLKFSNDFQSINNYILDNSLYPSQDAHVLHNNLSLASLFGVILHRLSFRCIPIKIFRQVTMVYFSLIHWSFLSVD